MSAYDLKGLEHCARIFRQNADTGDPELREMRLHMAEAAELFVARELAHEHRVRELKADLSGCLERFREGE